MKWRKSPPELVETFDAVLPPRAERRLMFGYPAAFVNGNMFMGLWQEHLILRLDTADRAELLATDGARVFEPMAGRPMKEYVMAPPALLGDRKALRHWAGRALRHAAALPPKAPRRARTAARATAVKPGASGGRARRGARRPRG